MQPAIPNLIWDWPTAGAGEISQDQFEFCDHIPASPDPDANFLSSAISFSQNYAGFLEIISPAFEPQSLLQTARQAAARPTIPTSSVAGPDGWVLVKNTAGVNRWQPNWIVSMTPNEFLAQTGSDSGSLSLTDQTILKDAIKEGLNLICFGENQNNLSSPNLNPGDIQEIQITAGSWGRVGVYPADWFNSSLLTLASDGPFVGSYTPAKIFGPKGLLPCRISEMIVAANLKAKVTFSKQFIGRHQETLLGAKHLELLGINLDLAKGPKNPNPVQLSSQGNTATLNVSSSTGAPSIIGIIIESYGVPSSGSG